MKVEMIGTLNTGLEQCCLNFSVLRITWETFRNKLPGNSDFCMPWLGPENLYFQMILDSGDADVANFGPHFK